MNPTSTPILRALLTLLASAGLVFPPRAQEAVDLDMITRLRAEGLKHSAVMETAWHLTDRLGPRLTNSPEERRASTWARSEFERYGLENAAIEAWGEFGLGWSYQRAWANLVAPTCMQLVALPKAWTRGLEAPLRGVPVLIDVSTIEELQGLRGSLAGKIVLFGRVRDVSASFEALAKRHDATSLAELLQRAAPSKPEEEEPDDAAKRRRELADAAMKLFAEEQVAIVLTPDGGRRKDYGVIFVAGGGSYDPKEPRALPQLVVSAEQWNRLARLVKRGEPVELELDVRTQFHGEDTLGRNIVAEIPGCDPELADELVMCGAHFDSWHAASGTTDNGCNSAVVLEAARLLQKAGAKPRRTIRFALWTGEEQGLLGSKGYVKQHFADPETMTLQPEHERLAAYFNLDNGVGRIRGIYCQENAAVMPIFRAWLEPFADLSATAVAFQTTGGTDHLSFDRVGLPGFQFVQDPLDYSTRSHHTNMDLYERIFEGDLQQSAVILASFVWHAAQREHKLPRKPLPSAEKREG